MTKKIIVFSVIILTTIASIFWITSFNTPNNQEVNLSYVGENIDPQFNPQQQEGYDNFLVNLNANLAVFDKNGKTQPYAAQSIEMAKNNLSVDIKLKSGLAFENGDKITAKEYLEGIKLLANPKTKASYASWVNDYIVGASDYAKGKTQNISGFKIKNDLNFTIELTKPIHYYKDMLVAINFSPVSKKYLDKVGIKNYGTNYKNYLSSGPLKLVDYKKNQSLTYNVNDKTSLSNNIPVKVLKIKFINSEVAQAQLFKNNKLSAILKSRNVDKILGNKIKDTKLINQDTPYMVYLANNSKSVSKEAAKALNLIIDKEYINKTFLNNTHKIRSVVTPNNYQELDNQIKKLGIDPNKQQFDANLAKKIDFDKSKTYSLWYDDSISDEVVKYIKSQAQIIGLKIEVTKLPSSQISKETYKKFGDRKYDFVIKSWGQDYTSPSSFLDTLFNSDTEVNMPNYSNEKFDELIKQAKIAKDSQEENKLYAQAAKIIYDENAISVIYQRVKPYYIMNNSFVTDVIGRLGVVNNWTKVTK